MKIIEAAPLVWLAFAAVASVITGWEMNVNTQAQYLKWAFFPVGLAIVLIVLPFNSKRAGKMLMGALTELGIIRNSEENKEDSDE